MKFVRTILIIGGGAAGLSAALNARKTDRNADIKLITQESRPAYSRCALPFIISGEIRDFNNILIYPSDFYKRMRIDLKLNMPTTNIDHKSRTATVSGESLQYDLLILATGGYTRKLEVKGIEKKGIYSLRTVEDCSAIMDAAKSSQDVVVVGGGVIAVEVADALRKIGCNVTIMVRSRLLRALLDEDMADIVNRRLTTSGVRLLPKKLPDKFIGNDKVRGVISGGDEVKADLVVLAVGEMPNTELASQVGVELGPTGGIKVNQRMETSVKGVYAAGDCVENTHLITQKPMLSMLGTVAVRQGKVAGVNAAGGDAIYPGGLNSTISRIFDLEVGSSGLTEWEAKSEGIDCISGAVSWKTRAEYYPGAKDIRVKLVVERESRRIIGGQIIGGENVASKLDMISLAIQSKLTVHNFANAETCYTPPLADTWNPLILAAESVLRRLK